MVESESSQRILGIGIPMVIPTISFFTIIERYHPYGVLVKVLSVGQHGMKVVLLFLRRKGFFASPRYV